MRNYQRLPRSAFVPLEITARLRCGVISDGLMMIDSVLYFAQHRETLGARDVTLSRQMVVNGESGGAMPLMRCEEDGPQWYYAASAARWNGTQAHGQDYWTKRLDQQHAGFMDASAIRAKVPTSGGAYRGYRMPVAYTHALSVTWCVVGEPALIRGLLRCMTHLGKKTDQGWGAVIDWTVTEAATDWSVRDGDVLTRPIPRDGGILYGFRPPYWLPRNQTACAMLGEVWPAVPRPPNSRERREALRHA